MSTRPDRGIIPLVCDIKNPADGLIGLSSFKIDTLDLVRISM